MRLLYITPRINDEGGVARVLSVKTDYLLRHYRHEVAIVTQNEGNAGRFFDFHPDIQYFDLKLRGNRLRFLRSYIVQVKTIISAYKPDIIIITDNGLKGFLFPLLVRTPVPVVFEAHGTKFYEQSEIKGLFSGLMARIRYGIRNLGVRYFDRFVTLSEENKREWNVANAVVISNPIWFREAAATGGTSLKVVAVARHSYEKGIDRMLRIWQAVIPDFPGWTLEVYGNHSADYDMPGLAVQLQVSGTVSFLKPVRNIAEKYKEAAFYMMTSRFEGFPMVLIEAMAAGIPAIATACPVGPSAIIEDGETGFLLPEYDEVLYIKKLRELMENAALRREMGKKALESAGQYELDRIMPRWQALFTSLKASR